MWLLIPLKNTESWWLSSSVWSYEELIDSKYDLYSVQMKNYPVPNVYNDWTHSSQEAWWLQIDSRSNQNQSWKDYYWLNVFSWNTNLNVHSFTWNFTASIKNIISWSIKSRLYSSLWNAIDFDWTAWRISEVRRVDSSDINIQQINTKWFIVNSWWNNFLVRWWTSANIYIVPCTNSWEPTWTEYTEEIDSQDLWWACRQWNVYIVWAKNEYFWIWYWAKREYAINWNVAVAMRWSLYKANSDWSITLIDHWTTISKSWWYSSYHSWEVSCWSYVKWNNIYFYSNAYSRSESPSYYARMREIWVIDMSNTTTFTHTTWKHDEDNSSWYFDWITDLAVVWFDWTNIIYVDSSKDIQQCTNAWVISDTWSDYIASIYNHPACYRNSVTKLENFSNNIIADDDELNIHWTITSWWITDIYRYHVRIYKTDWVNEEDDALEWMLVKWISADYQNNLILNLNINWVLNEKIIDYTNYIWPSIIDTTSAIPYTDIDELFIKFHLELINPSWINLKLWFWATWWTYASPSWWYENSTINITL